MEISPKRPHRLVVCGASGMLASQLIFLVCAEGYVRELVLHGSDLKRLRGVEEEIRDAGFDLELTLTTDLREAVSSGGDIFYATSVRSGSLTREEMLLDNAPSARDTGMAIAEAEGSIHRVVCVSNPSDLVGLSILVHSRLHPEQVMSLSALDTMRYQKELIRALGIRRADILDGWTLGSHDESMAVMRDTPRINGKSLDQLIHEGLLSESKYEEIRHGVVKGGARIIKLRGHTSYQSPAWLAYLMLRATDENPFSLPTARYLHTDGFEHIFLSLPGEIGSRGCFQESLEISKRDYEELKRSYASVREQRDILIENGLLPPIDQWREELHNMLSPEVSCK